MFQRFKAQNSFEVDEDSFYMGRGVPEEGDECWIIIAKKKNKTSGLQTIAWYGFSNASFEKFLSAVIENRYFSAKKELKTATIMRNKKNNCYFQVLSDFLRKNMEIRAKMPLIQFFAEWNLKVDEETLVYTPLHFCFTDHALSFHTHLRPLQFIALKHETVSFVWKMTERFGRKISGTVRS